MFLFEIKQKNVSIEGHQPHKDILRQSLHSLRQNLLYASQLRLRKAEINNKVQSRLADLTLNVLLHLLKPNVNDQRVTA